MTVRWRSLASAAALGLILVGCQSSSDGRSADSTPEIRFKDDAEANADPGESLANLEFVDPSGKKIRPRDFLGRKNLVLVFTRGYNGSICPYCSAYTSGLIANYRAMTERDAEVVVVYPIAKPGDSRRLDEFLAATFQQSTPSANGIPFPLVLDVGLNAVNTLGIRKDLSKPATYILDKKGHAHFAYVGNTLSDRPSIKVILKQLDALVQEPG